MGSGCKPDGNAYGGSNPSRPTTQQQSTDVTEESPRRGALRALARASAGLQSIHNGGAPNQHPIVTAAETTASVSIPTGRLLSDRTLGVLRRGVALARASKPRVRPLPFEGWDFLWRPAVLGFVALVAIAVGSSFSNSPFKNELPHTWFFGVPTRVVSLFAPVNTTTMLLGITLVYGGLVLLVRVWIRLAGITYRHAGAPIRKLRWILALWTVPMLGIGPVFSNDVYSYAAQGEMVTRHLSPYAYGPWVLGSGPWVTPVDAIWRYQAAPYGPLFLMIDSWIVRLTGHSELATVVGLRLLEVLAVVLLAWAVPVLAKALGYEPGNAFVMCLLSPLVVLTLVGGAHNDGIMMALLIAGLALAAKRHPVWGIIVCALAASIKIPAAIGIVYIAWQWLGPDLAVRLRLRPLVVAGLLAGAVFGALTYASGLGLGWILDLGAPGKVTSWAAPATGLGMLLTQVCHLAGYNVQTATMISITRGIGLVVAAAWMLWLLFNADRIGWLRALGLSMLAIVVLGPVVQPWYLSWGILLLAPLAIGKLRSWLIALSVVSPFLGLPGGHQLLDAIVATPMIQTGCVLFLLWALLGAPLGRWTSYGQEPEPVTLLATRGLVHEPA